MASPGSGKPSIIAYSGKRGQHDAHYIVPSRERALQWAGEYMGKLQARAKDEAERRAAIKALRAAGHELKPGDVLSSSWGRQSGTGINQSTEREISWTKKF